ncbi:MAG: UDP-2,3-diacylglucosamine diphosphatase [Muribaculaceae bacterium]|nr:UDP-2,3-diacylglucosamine diphosphatase [Muribaculaceae bacterium]
MKTCTYFISDTHLGSGTKERARERELLLCRWLESIEPTAKRLYMLGDMLDFWWEYRTVVPRGFVRFFGALARLADSGTEIVWLRGNHDIWLKDYLATEIPCRVVTGSEQVEIDGTWFFLEHGDGVGYQPRAYRMLRAFFHNKVAQKMYSWIHPRWAIAIAGAWSRKSRKSHGKHEVRVESCSKAMDALKDFAMEYHAQEPKIRYFLFGHLHYPMEIDLKNEIKMIVLGGWFSHPTYAVFDGKALTVKKVEPESESKG